MKNNPKVAVLGGDLRQYAAAKQISKVGFEVSVHALCTDTDKDSGICFCQSLGDAVADARAVILPLPVSTDDRVLNSPAFKSNERISLDKIVDIMSADAILAGGKIPAVLRERAEKKGIRVYDYFLSESLQIKNAYITAEAAMSIAMNSLDKCLKDARVAVTGSGRISRILTELLRRMGTEVTVAARNRDVLAYSALLGCDTVVISDNVDGKKWSEALAHGYDIIFNTVPSWIFDREFLSSAEKNIIFIELASAPGGIDICAARELSSNVLWASSLPGKYAPESAGRLIAEYVCDILYKEVDV
jgi:dipicolinate synthase subunit A